MVQRLRFRASHLPAVRDGSKRMTMRFHDPVQVGPALLVFESDDEVSLPGHITSTESRPARIAQRESAAFTRRMSQVRSLVRALAEQAEVVAVAQLVESAGSWPRRSPVRIRPVTLMFGLPS